MLRDIFKFLASLKLALLLLTVIIVAVAFGTFYESELSADVARKYIYNAVWFNLWLTMLCVNLFSVAAIRYPWKPHQTGFVITHAGIIIMLIGGMIDRKWGIEGYMHLNRGQPSTDVMELHEEEILVFTPESPEPGRTRLRVNGLATAADCAFPLNTPSPGVKAQVLDVQPVTPEREVTPAAADGHPAIRMTLQGPMMGRHEQWLMLNDHFNLGPATLRFLSGEPPATAENKDKMMPRLERYFLFQSEGAMKRTLAGAPTGAEAQLLMDEKGASPVLKLKLFGKTFSIPVKDHIKKSYPLDGLEDWRVFIVNYFPNFVMTENNQPGTRDDKPERPCVYFDLTGPLVEGSETPPETDPHGGAKDGAAANALAVYLGEDGKLRYWVKARTKGESSGVIELEKPVPVAWQPGVEFVVHEFLPKGAARPIWKAQPGKGSKVKQLDKKIPGALCRITAGGETKEFWLGQTSLQVTSRTLDDGTQQSEVEYRKLPVEVGGKKIELAFSARYVRLPFRVGLLKFNAPYQEGLENSATFMAFESSLSFDNQQDTVRLKPGSRLIGSKYALPSEPAAIKGVITEMDESNLTLEFYDRRVETLELADTIEIDKRSHKIHMNHPTTYPVKWWGPWVGTCYKFSQANHKMPEDPDYSGVQVLRDPGWMPKWVGSLMICFGIFTMFYLKPYFKRKPQTAAAAPRNAPPVEAAQAVARKPQNAMSSER